MVPLKYVARTDRVQDCWTSAAVDWRPCPPRSPWSCIVVPVVGAANGSLTVCSPCTSESDAARTLVLALQERERPH